MAMSACYVNFVREANKVISGLREEKGKLKKENESLKIENLHLTASMASQGLRISSLKSRETFRVGCAKERESCIKELETKVSDLKEENELYHKSEIKDYEERGELLISAEEDTDEILRLQSVNSELLRDCGDRNKFKRQRDVLHKNLSIGVYEPMPTSLIDVLDELDKEVTDAK